MCTARGKRLCTREEYCPTYGDAGVCDCANVRNDGECANGGQGGAAVARVYCTGQTTQGNCAGIGAQKKP